MVVCATVVERFVNILRHNYSEVNFIVPDYAYSAGTIFCMSGDKYIDGLFISTWSHRPADSKQWKERMVAALGYLDKSQPIN